MELRNIGLIYKGKKLVNLREVHITTKFPKNVRIVYNEYNEDDCKDKEICGNIREFQIFDKSESK
ncbi:MAG: hypothetical protein NC078_04760 [Ruminococcus sp.]|nr:hypothetical protein [Ruminococcus sp.]